MSQHPPRQTTAHDPKLVDRYGHANEVEVTGYLLGVVSRGGVLRGDCPDLIVVAFVTGIAVMMGCYHALVRSTLLLRVGGAIELCRAMVRGMCYCLSCGSLVFSYCMIGHHFRLFYVCVRVC